MTLILDLHGIGSFTAWKVKVKYCYLSLRLHRPSYIEPDSLATPDKF